MTKTLRSASIGFALGVVASGTILSLLLHGSLDVIKCTTGDLAASLGAERPTSLEPTEYGWVRRARQCDIGEYVVVTPERNGNNAIVVLRKGSIARMVFAATTDGANLFDPDGKRGLRGLVVRLARDTTALFNVGGKGEQLTVGSETITLFDRDVKRVLVSIDRPKSRPGSMAYSTYDASRGAWIENVIGPDGNLELRRTDVPGHPLKTEIRVGGRWLEHVERDGRWGTVLDGRFMSVVDARAKLGVKAKHP
jgi:hypothetical protein